MCDDIHVEFYEEMENGVFLRLVRRDGERHAFISCLLTDVTEVETAIRLLVEKIADGYVFKGIITTPDEWHELWLVQPNSLTLPDVTSGGRQE